MACNGCGKGNRHNKMPSIAPGDIDQNNTLGVKQGSFTPVIEVSRPQEIRSPIAPSDEGDHLSAPPTNKYQEALEEIKKLSFDDIMSRLEHHRNQTALQMEATFSEMTDVMRHFHTLSWVSIANYDNLSTPGVSPDQAVVALKAALDRKDFNHINELYPTLKAQVDARFQELMSKRIVL